MKDFYYDNASKDLTLTDTKDLRFTIDIVEYTVQKIEKVLSVVLGEWYLNRTIGLPYIAQNNNDRDDRTKNIFVKNPDLAFINGQFTIAIVNISTIDRLISLNSELDTNTRTLNVEFEALLTNGDVLQDTVNIGVL